MTKPVGCCGKNIEYCGVLAAVIGRVDLDRDGVCPEDGGEKLSEHDVLKFGYNYPPRLLVDFLIIPRWCKLMNLFSNSELKVKKKYHFLPSNIQGDLLERSESYCLLLIKYENYELFNPARDSQDVVHLII